MPTVLDILNGPGEIPQGLENVPRMIISVKFAIKITPYDILDRARILVQVTIYHTVSFGLVEKTISTNPKPTIYCNSYETTGPAKITCKSACQVYGVIPIKKFQPGNYIGEISPNFGARTFSQGHSI